MWTTLGEISNYGECNNVSVDSITDDDWVLELEDLEKDTAKIIQTLSRSKRSIKGVRHRFNKGDILYSKLRTYLNKVLVAPQSGYCTTEIMPFNSYCNVSSYYLNHVLRSAYFLDYTQQCGYGVKMPRLSTTDACNGMIPLPPLAEQKRIVKEIEHWFSLIDVIESGKEDLQATIKQAKSKILDLAIHGKLVPQDPNDEPASELLKRINSKAEITCDNGHSRKLPQGWAYCQLSNVLKITMGQSPKGDSLNNKRGIEFHQGKICFSDKFLLESGIFTNEPTKIAEPNSILLCVRAPVGVVNITKNQICIGRGLCALTPFEGNVDFYFYLLQTLQDSFDNQSTGTTFKAISGEIIRNENIILPPLAEQQRIVQKIEELFHVFDNIQNALEV
ncbi:restriction endonuclease subunit S [Bacteroides ovatus]|uniref:Type I restriction modification DNA specificity domain protein n=2 Tax=Bacteroidaceae TaxID=815 RepID=B3JQ24_9BACT|nr:restriction endonuclease subunit S [Bacteroides ovatus]EDU98942.1 type I restriction modification DNA specificity domain protein [Phocaeicola coprocola DSM 17136]MDC2773829.1 restriction endonuclease subunit S [Bacteroides ovatus]MDC2783225.1 restriction endonuclease subunit S [Bacteroides ovatus]MDC2788284.1 restriction endonuclease subunit S [Bacteroides ovatus]MDC2792807.1 restriction endonuclease subunit S [Bacteroides ovatus]